MSKSLVQISEAYTRSKDRLLRDLNKMESQMRKLKDTRERISMKHIKSLDLLAREVDRIMPAELHGEGNLQEGPESDAEVDSQIKKDLESEDIFSIAYRSGQVQQEGNLQPEEEWLPSEQSFV